MKVSIVGCAGVPAAYGGFETLAENLAIYREQCGLGIDLTIFCSARGVGKKISRFHGASLDYLSLSANGVSSIFYDVFSMVLALRGRSDVILLLGVSGAIALPLIRIFRRVRVVTNIDGVEWRRAKWGWFARHFLQFSEWLAVRFSDVVVADNQGVAKHVADSYGASCVVIAYGGDHATDVVARPYSGKLPDIYAFALCRIEPENNISMILEAFARMPELPLVFVGNWDASVFGQELRERYRNYGHLLFLDPEYDLGVLKALRLGACLYVHGHSAGGTNPSLVEMMHFGVPVICYDCAFNRYTTFDRALYFSDAEELISVVIGLDAAISSEVGSHMSRLAQQHYTWKQVGAEYFKVLKGADV